MGLLHTHTERAFISLFDTDYQYLLAEATASTPLTPSLPSDECSSPLLLCGHAIPRHHGVCEHVLRIDTDKNVAATADITDLDVFIVPDLSADSRFSSKSYCQPPQDPQIVAANFYAAVPIRTNRGINIGTYSVRGPQAIARTWTDASSRHLQEISYAIMSHLEANRAKYAYRRNERIARGLGSFIEGKSTLSGWKYGSNEAAFANNADPEGRLDVEQQNLESNHEAHGDLEAEAVGTLSFSRRGGSDTTNPTNPNTDSTNTNSTDIDLIASNTNPSDINLTNTNTTNINTANPDIKTTSTQSHSAFYDASHKPQSRWRVSQSNTATHHNSGDGATGDNTTITGTNTTISRAANLIRETFEVEGCVFFDITMGSYKNADSQFNTTAGHHHPRGNFSSSSGTSSSDEQRSIDPTEDDNSNENNDFCSMLGFAATTGSSINSKPMTPDMARMPKRLLAKLLRRHPNGKIYNFDALGELQTSDSSEDERQSAKGHSDTNEDNSHLNVNPKTTKPRSAEKASRRIREGARVYQAFPFVRSIAFFPIWDAKRQRWLAGGFVYTLTPTRSFTVEGELSLLRAFSNLIATEISSLETLNDDRAKSDVLGSLSHELRSPLHGVILSTELLNDTELDVYQGNATHTIEICCRTLLDTIDHLLDHAKINSFASHRQLGGPGNGTASASPLIRRRPSPTQQFGKKHLYYSARLDGIVEEVMESVFAGFNFQYMSIHQLARKGSVSKSASASVSASAASTTGNTTGNTTSATGDNATENTTAADVAAHLELDSSQAMEQLHSHITNINSNSPNSGNNTNNTNNTSSINSGNNTNSNNGLQFGNVAVYLLADPTCNWLFSLPSGAIRRIVMNLFGNSLKFTSKGSICVSISQDKPYAKRKSTERIVKLVVQDTGKGISPDYIKHRLFKPFAQEDELVVGTGLGLSLVRQIVTALHGQILVESQVGVGTKITVTLPLEQITLPQSTVIDRAEDDVLYEEQIRDLKGLRIRLNGQKTSSRTPKTEDTAKDEDDRSDQTRLNVIETICRDTLHLQILGQQQEATEDELRPDMVLWLETALPPSSQQIDQYMQAPNIVVCQDALVAYRRFTDFEAAGRRGIFEFISQP